MLRLLKVRWDISRHRRLSVVSLHHGNRSSWLPTSHPRHCAHGHPGVGLALSLTWLLLLHHLRILHAVVVVLLLLLRIALLRLAWLLVGHGC